MVSPAAVIAFLLDLAAIGSPSALSTRVRVFNCARACIRSGERRLLDSILCEYMSVY